MHRRLILGVLVLLSGVSPTVCAAQPKSSAAKIPTGYRVQTTLALPSAGAQERLELLTDVRINAATDDEDAYGKKNAILRLIGSRGQVVRQEALERSRATLSRATLQGNRARPTYQLTVNYSVGMGSYNGPITFWVEAGEGQVRFLMAGGKRIAVMDSLKTAWKLVPSPTGPGKDILEVACRPAASVGKTNSNPNQDFEVIYTRYHFTGRAWQRKVARRFGFWEVDHPFPALSRFPR